ncbi:MAG: hypothetical protein NTU85_03590 [Candidatus Kaiserbacteria bacterium]|nr:hypothetical protein [Candidatus Kaiserbacteria bacterium]
MENLEIARIRRDGGTQPRAALDETTLAEYAEALGAGAEFPAVDVFFDGERYWLADGFHRLVAHERAGKYFILAIIHQGNQRAAVLFSTGVNADHGLRRSNADKRRAVEVLLRDAEWGKWADREIAKQCKVGHPLVSEMRKTICPQWTDTLSGSSSRYEPSSANEAQINTPIERTVTRGDSTFTMNIAPIAEANAARAATWASVDALAAGIRAYLEAIFIEDPVRQKEALYQVKIMSSQGKALLDERLMRSSYLPGPRRRNDVLSAVYQVLAEYERPAGRVVDAVDEVDGVDAARMGTAGPNGARVPTEAEVAALAETLRPAVWQWLKPDSELDRWGALLWQKSMTGRLLDLEGFSAKRGRNFDWEHLVGMVGAGVDQGALRLTVGLVRTEIVGRLEGVDAVDGVDDHGQTPRTATHGQARTSTDEVDKEAEAEPLTAAVEKWLYDLAEACEIPTDRGGAPEKDAVRVLLRSVLHNRSNGGAAAWRALRGHPAWPAGMGDGTKLEAVRAALRELTGGRDEAEAEGGTRGREVVDPAVIAASVRRSGLVAKVTARLHGHFDCLLAYAAARPEADPALAEMLVEVQGILDLLEG